MFMASAKAVREKLKPWQLIEVAVNLYIPFKINGTMLAILLQMCSDRI